MARMTELGDTIEVRIGFAELLGLPVPLGLPKSPCTATVGLPDEFEVWQAQAAAVAQEEGLDMGDYGRVSVTAVAREDGGTDVVFLFPPRLRR